MFVFICVCGGQHPLFETYLALVHTRFSTNTFPSWERAHPLRLVIQMCIIFPLVLYQLHRTYFLP